MFVYVGLKVPVLPDSDLIRTTADTSAPVSERDKCGIMANEVAHYADFLPVVVL